MNPHSRMMIEQAFQVEDTAPYPNRSLGLQYTHTGLKEAYDPAIMAQVALANLQPGEFVYIQQVLCQVIGITDDQLTLDHSGEVMRYPVHSDAFDRLIEAVAQQMHDECEPCHGQAVSFRKVSPAMRWYHVVRRDPAYQVKASPPGVPYF